MAVYIKGIGNISPQKTWGEGPLLAQPCDYIGDRLTCIEPDYTQYLDPGQLRRMSRVIKMGMASALLALQEAGIKVPDRIITGTGYGCLEDTGIFLGKMLENREHALNPTPFIQSTHNTIGSQIALLLKCQGYNQTYTQGALSFEASVLDAVLELRDSPAQTILVGGVDEITDPSQVIQERFGMFKNHSASSLNLFSSSSPGTINGEGAVYFVLSGQKGDQDKVSVDAITTFYKPNQERLLNGIRQFLEATRLKESDIDLVLLGICGDAKLDEATQEISKTVFSASAIGSFKHLCGEYPTASAFALWLGARIIQAQQIPPAVGKKNNSTPLQNVLIYNSYFGKYHSLILLRAC